MGVLWPVDMFWMYSVLGWIWPCLKWITATGNAARWAIWYFLICMKLNWVVSKLMTRRQNFRFIQIETNCRRHFKVHLEWKISTIYGRKHCEKRRNRLLRAIFSSTGHRPASYCHGIVSVVLLSAFLRPYTFPSDNFSSETIDWSFTKFHRRVPLLVLFQIPSNNCVPWRILVAMATKVKTFKNLLPYH